MQLDDAGSEEAAERAVRRAASRARAHHAERQVEAGYWPADYSGPLFLLPGLLIRFLEII